MTEIFVNPKSFVSLKELVIILRMNETTLRKIIKNGLFPKPCIRPGIGYSNKAKKFWLYSDIMKFIDEMKEGEFSDYASEPQKHLKVRKSNFGKK